ncbi:MFS transporter [Roseateles sp. DAIF2]|uniref:MFS transporter n=1 Tax=Roseateles sp. DAIF2 TaxID=2714952 RepID=UPI0018A2F8B5|nr:MFS transporter [Roseateles sp. DAIF2]QPF76104.1 MFS transporter [Roseateles sp. DAIF2]
MSSESPPSPAAAPWSALFTGTNGWLALALTGGVALHAINVHIVTTVLPSVVQDIGGLDWYAWNTTLFVVASIVGAVLSVRLLAAAGPRSACLAALAVFALGSALCAGAPSMPWMLIGRSVQGLGGGTLAALSYALIRIVFPPVLWPRAVALVSGMWGVATLCGPAVGGLYAQAGHWRWAFWTLLPVSLLQTLLVALKLRGGAAGQPRAGLPLPQVALLAASVLAVAAGGLAPGLALQGLGVAAGLALGAAAIAWDRRASVRLLPTGATRLRSPLGAVYASVALLLVGTTTEIFVPYFLQTLHGHTPLAAGYLTAAMAAGWSAGSLLSSGCGGDRAARLLRAGPVLCTAGLLALALLVPAGAGLPARAFSALCGVALACVGAGVGLGWPHLVTRVMTLAPSGETGTASAAITTVQLYGMAIGAAVAGLLANAAGLTRPGGLAGAQSAAVWLFASFALAPAGAALLAQRITRRAGREAR